MDSDSNSERVPARDSLPEPSEPLNVRAPVFVPRSMPVLNPGTPPRSMLTQTLNPVGPTINLRPNYRPKGSKPGYGLPPGPSPPAVTEFLSQLAQQIALANTTEEGPEFDFGTPDVAPPRTPVLAGPRPLPDQGSGSGSGPSHGRGRGNRGSGAGRGSGQGKGAGTGRGLGFGLGVGPEVETSPSPVLGSREGSGAEPKGGEGTHLGPLSEVAGVQGSGTVPDASKLAEIREKLQNQLEFYLGDENLPSDNFLLNEMDSHGFVSLQVLRRFNKVKKILAKKVPESLHQQLLQESVLQSKKMVLSNDQLKVGRVDPLSGKAPDFQEHGERSVVVDNLPTDQSIENIESIFSKCGKVSVVRVIHPNNDSKKNIKHKTFFSTNKVHAIVEFETSEDAEKAVKELNDSNNWRNGLRVRLISKLISQGAKHNPKLAEKKMDTKVVSPIVEGSHERDESHLPINTSGHNSDHSEHGKKGGKKGSTSSRPISGKPSPKAKNGGFAEGTPPKYFLSASPLSRSPLGRGEGLHRPPVTSGPKMPDGTRGFAMGRGKKISVVVS